MNPQRLAPNLRELAEKFPRDPLYSGQPAANIRNAPRATRMREGAGDAHNKMPGSASGDGLGIAPLATPTVDVTLLPKQTTRGGRHPEKENDGHDRHLSLLQALPARPEADQRSPHPVPTARVQRLRGAELVDAVGVAAEPVRGAMSDSTVEEVTPEEGRALFDEAARWELGISGAEFLRRYDAFDIPDDWNHGSVVRLEILIPFARG